MELLMNDGYQGSHHQGYPGEWHLMSCFVLRRTGFPFEWLQQLRFPETAARLPQLFMLRAQLRQLQKDFEDEIFPSLCEEEFASGADRSFFRAWYRIARDIRRGQLISSELVILADLLRDRPVLAIWVNTWQDILRQSTQLRAEAEERFCVELAERRQTLHNAIADSQFQEALWLSNPAIYEIGWEYYMRHWDTMRRPSKIKHLERRFYTYLQRFCAKNDTTSFFGPLNYGSFTSESGLIYRITNNRIRQRRVFMAYWATNELAKCIAREASIRPFLCPRKNPLRPLPSHLRNDVYALSDGHSCARDIALRLQRSLNEVLADIETFVGAGYLHFDVPIPPSTLQPLDYLFERVSALPSDCSGRQLWINILSYFKGVCNKFALADFGERRMILADLEGRYSELTGTAPRRGEGRMFQDRTLVYEECLGNIDQFQLDTIQHERIQKALTPIAALCTTYGALLLRDLQEAGKSLFDELSPSGGSLPLIRFVIEWCRRYPEPPVLPSTLQLRQSLQELIVHRTKGNVCTLSAEDIVPLCSESVDSTCISPDLLLAAKSIDDLTAGRYQLVLGEVHHGMQPVGWMLSFISDTAYWERELTACLPVATDQAVPSNLVFGRNMKTAPPEFVGPSIETSATASRSPRLPLHALAIRRAGEDLRVYGPGDDRPLRFYPPAYSLPARLYYPYATFAYPLGQTFSVQVGEHTPRIEIDGVVYQRERWDLPTARLPIHTHPRQGSSFQLFLDYFEFRQPLGVPNHVFVRTPSEPKPVFIDFENYFALELLSHLASKADTISIVEMWPDPEHLWMKDEYGSYSCELRTVMSSIANPVISDAERLQVREDE
jgi:hypothetical protein